MNRRQKIIVSVVGIFIVLLALVGITYGYFLTRIQGNTNTTSISVTTADLRLEYGDGNEELIAEKIMPGKQISFLHLNDDGTSTSYNEKTFTVENKGNVAIENYNVGLEYALTDVMPSIFDRPNDFKITLTCVSKNAITGEVSGTCSGSETEWNNNSYILVSNSIAKGIRHEYKLSIYYDDPGVDQSKDMNKNLNLKVQIYASSDRAELTGEITGVDDTYVMKLNSEPKISVIKNIGTEKVPVYQYKFIGVAPDNHKLSLVDKNDNEISNTRVVIQKGNTTIVDGNTITIGENNNNIYIETKKNGNDLSFSATINPFEDENTLAYNIFNNAIKTSTYKETPLTTPLEQTSAVKYEKLGVEGNTQSRIRLSIAYQSYYWTYATEYNIDENTGKFSLVNPKTCKYDEAGCLSDLVSTGKDIYIAGNTPNYNAKQENELVNTLNLDGIYRVVTAPAASGANTWIIAHSISSVSYSIESELSPFKEGNETSYYFRGYQNNNYVEFNDMCFRIVRIESDGSVKLILAKDGLCSSITETDTTSAFLETTGCYGYQKITGNFNPGGYRGDFINGQCLNNNILNAYDVLENWFNSTFKNGTNLTENGNKIKNDTWCLGYDFDYKYDITTGMRLDDATLQERLDSSTEEHPMLKWLYASGKRIKIDRKISLACGEGEGSFDSLFGTLNGDEMILAGSSRGYLEDNANDDWILLSIGENQVDDGVDNYGGGIGNITNIRPSITLKPTNTISNTDMNNLGSKTNPYKIS